MKLLKISAILLILSFSATVAKGQCPSSFVDLSQLQFNGSGSSLSFTATFVACSNDGFGGSGNNSPTLRVVPVQGPPKNITFTNSSSGLSAQVNKNAASQSTTLRRGQGSNEFDVGTQYTDNISFENPNGLFEFQLCLFRGQGNNTSPVTCSSSAIFELPNPTLSVVPDIDVSLKPSTPSNTTEVFTDQVTVSYTNFSGGDLVEFQVPMNLPSEWVLEANVENTGWQDVSSPITFNPNPNGNNKDGSFTIQYRVTVPLYESPQLKDFTATYEVQ